jgi:hypothetical protein
MLRDTMKLILLLNSIRQAFFFTVIGFFVGCNTVSPPEPITEVPGNGQLWVMNADGSKKQQLTNFRPTMP